MTLAPFFLPPPRPIFHAMGYARSILPMMLALSLLVATNILTMHTSISLHQDRDARGEEVGDAPRTNNTNGPPVVGGHSSGVGIVTVDGLWDDEYGMEAYRDADVRILGFTDRHYLPIAMVWYNRLADLGYTEHYVVANDEESLVSLRALNMRVIPCLIRNPEYDKQVKGLGRQIMSSRLHLTMDMLRNGTHLLVTDIDNIFTRRVPLRGFLAEGYDVYHAYEMKFPLFLYDKYGFVICGGHSFFRSSPETLRFMDIVMKHCNKDKCNDQIMFNNVLFHELDIAWDGIDDPNHAGAMRLNTTGDAFKSALGINNILVEGVTGRSKVTNHTIKIWDRDFAWRLSGGGIPKYCPSKNNWVSMPTAQEHIPCSNNVDCKLKTFEVWDKFCGGKSEDPRAALMATHAIDATQ